MSDFCEVATEVAHIHEQAHPGSGTRIVGTELGLHIGGATLVQLPDGTTCEVYRINAIHRDRIEGILAQEQAAIAAAEETQLPTH